MKTKYVIQNQLKSNRKSIGYTQKEVAEILGLNSVAQISRWERGERNPNLKQALQLSALYHRLVNDLFWDLYQDQIVYVTSAKKKFENKIIH